MKAKAIEFVAPSVVQVIDVDIPEPGANDAIVRTTFSGISSGTETLAFTGGIDPEVELDESIGALEGTFAFPFRYGYSCVGVVERERLEVAVLYLYLAAAIVGEIAATVSLKLSEGFSRLWPSVVVVLGYVVAFTALSRALKLGMPVGVAYAVWSAIGV